MFDTNVAFKWKHARQLLRENDIPVISGVIEHELIRVAAEDNINLTNIMPNFARVGDRVDIREMKWFRQFQELHDNIDKAGSDGDVIIGITAGFNRYYLIAGDRKFHKTMKAAFGSDSVHWFN